MNDDDNPRRQLDGVISNEVTVNESRGHYRRTLYFYSQSVSQIDSFFFVGLGRDGE